METKDLLKCLSALSVFFIFFFIPILFFRQIKINVENMEIKEGLNNIRLWSDVYKAKNGNYKGIENDPEIKRIMLFINYMGNDCKLFSNDSGNNFCVKAKIKNIIMSRNWCVDNTGYSGLKINNCDLGKEIKCE
jgi:hypothetical protein